jgi:phosphate uptake regulator
MIKGEKLSRKTSEELRKIQVTGGSTYIVSLPKNWVEQMGLQRGSVIRINQEDDLTLVLQPQGTDKAEKPRRVIITETENDSPESVVRKIVSSYLIGYNIITLKSSGNKRLNSATRFAVKDFTRKKLVGTEILSDLPTELTLQVLLSYTELSVKDALRRMSIISASMHRDALITLNTEDPHLAREIISMDDEVDRFSLYIIRLLKVAVSDSTILKESGLNTPRQCLGYRLITKSIERMADHAVNIAQNRLALVLSVVDNQIFEELKKLSDLAINIFETSVESLFDENYIEADEALDKVMEIRSMEAKVIQKIIKHSPPEEVPSLRLIIESILRTAEYGADIAEIVLNMTIREVIKES